MQCNALEKNKMTVHIPATLDNYQSDCSTQMLTLSSPLLAVKQQTFNTQFFLAAHCNIALQSMRNGNVFPVPVRQHSVNSIKIAQYLLLLFAWTLDRLYHWEGLIQILSHRQLFCNTEHVERVKITWTVHHQCYLKSICRSSTYGHYY